MKIKILQDGLYNGLDRRAVDCKAGDELETSPAYGALLVEDGLAEIIEEEPAVKAPKKRQRREKDTGRKPAPNPFMP